MSVWDKRIERALKWLEKSRKHGQAVYERYEDDRSETNTANVDKVNLFYANVNTLKQSLYNSPPKPDVSRVHKGNYTDDISRVACLIADRVLQYEVECAPDFGEAIDLAILDRLVPGIGQVWLSFDIDKVVVKDEDEDDTDNGPTEEQVVPNTEHIEVEHVHWCDFIYEPSRRWSKVGWVGRAVYYCKEDFIKKFGQEKYDDAGASNFDRKTNDTGAEEVNKDKICVYEIWDKKTKKVFFIYKGMEDPLLEMDDPLKLSKFFPCPRPLIANVTSNKFLPVTDYHLAQDQYRQLDQIYARTGLIIKAVKVAGLYDSSNTAIQRMLTEGENILIPVDNWAMHAERGGTKGMIDWYPVEQVASVLAMLEAQFQAVKALLSEVSGMSDITRGDSNQYETAKAQTIKAQFASVRMNGYQRDVAVFVRDVMRIVADIAFGLYSDEKLIAVVGELTQPDMQFARQAVKILRNDLASKYKVDIEANSLTQEDWALEKGQRVEAITTLGSMIGQIMPMIKEVPQLATLGVQMIKFTIAGYKGASELEGWIDQQLDAMLQAQQQAQANPQPPQPSPEEIKVQGEQQMMQAEMQMSKMKFQQDQQLAQQKMELEVQKLQAQMAHDQQMNQVDLQMKEMELQFKEREFGMKLQMNAISGQQDLAVQQQASQQDLAVKQATGEQALQQKQAQHEQTLKQAKETPKPPKGAK